MAEISSSPPERYGVVVFPGFQSLDVFGPLDILNTLGRDHPISLSIIAATLDPVSTRPPNLADNKSPRFAESVVPTHTFETAPADLEVLIIPGGQGTRSPETVAPIHTFLKKTVPNLIYLLTVCTGSAVVAQTGLLDQRRATSNKRAWEWVTSQGVNVKWVGHARWVVDDPSAQTTHPAKTPSTEITAATNTSSNTNTNTSTSTTSSKTPIWSSSGIAAGMDMTFAFVKYLYGKQIADELAVTLEYERHEDSTYDPFAVSLGVPRGVWDGEGV